VVPELPVLAKGIDNRKTEKQWKFKKCNSSVKFSSYFQIWVLPIISFIWVLLLELSSDIGGIGFGFQDTEFQSRKRRDGFFFGIHKYWPSLGSVSFNFRYFRILAKRGLWFGFRWILMVFH
jgi:hypothetical protein